MVNKARSDDRLDSILELIISKIGDLEDNLLKNDIPNDDRFIKWQDDFKMIYGEKSVNLQLYITHAIYYLMGYSFILEHVLLDEKDINFLDNNSNIFDKIKEETEKKYPNMQIFGFEYFTPIIDLLKDGHVKILYILISKITEFILSLGIRPEYLFDYLTHNIISPAIRHQAGEYYTPPFLVKKMVNEVYNFGEKVLDPCCGSGNFLIEIINTIINSERTEKEKKQQ